MLAVIASVQTAPQQPLHLRLASGWGACHDDSYASRVKEPPRHSTVKLSWGHVLILGNIVDAIYERRALAAVSRRIRRDFSSPNFQWSASIRAALHL